MCIYATTAYIICPYEFPLNLFFLYAKKEFRPWKDIITEYIYKL